MDEPRFTLFPTPIGDCAIVMSGRGVAGFQLPERDRATALARLTKRWPGLREAEACEEAAEAIRQVRALLRGEDHDFSDIRLDLAACPAFNRQVYDLALAVPPGQTKSYGELARALGDVALSRAVGRALGENPIPVIVPCHRILAADGGTGGFSAPGGLDTKFRLLNIEMAFARPEPNLFGDQPLPLARRRG